jgi:ribonucleotide monophosphatase NagD (HAD superfamily)
MVDILSNYFKIPSEKIVIIGDRLYTDIATGVNANITSILVLSGETTINMVKDSSIKPDLIFNSVKDLIQLL